MDLDLKDKVVFINGSTRGIGRSIAEIFIKEGAFVTICGRNKKEVNQFCAKYQDKTIGICSDLLNEDNIADAVKKTISKFGKIDIAVANIGNGSDVSGWFSNNWEKSLSINFMSGVGLINAIIPHMISRRHGSVIFISSIAGAEVTGAPISYSVSKSAVISYSKNLSKLVAGDGIRVNCISPGNIYFNDGTWYWKLRDNPVKFDNYIKNVVPMKRFGKPEEIADLVCYLSSSRASFITGAHVVADGGQTHV